MTRAEFLDKLTGILRETFGDENLQIGMETTAEDVDGWDSIKHVQLILQVEMEFGVRFYPGEVGALHNIGSLVDLLVERS